MTTYKPTRNELKKLALEVPKKLKTRGQTLLALDLSELQAEPQAVKNIVALCPHIEELNLNRACDSDDLLMLFDPLPLKSLNIDGCLRLTTAAIEHLVKVHPHLQHLNVAHLPRMKDGWLHLIATLIQLQSLDINLPTHLSDSMRQVTDEGIKALIALTSLQRLDMRGHLLTEEAFTIFSHLPHLVDLKVDRVTDRALKEISKSHRLERLHLRSLHAISDLAIMSLSILRQLRSLTLEYSSGDIGLLGKSLFKLRELDLFYCNAKTLDMLSNLTELERLKMSGCTEFTDESFAHFFRLKKLHTLELPHQEQITKRGFSYIGNIEGLKCLNLNWCYQIGDEELTALSTLPELEELFLGWCEKITLKGLEPLKTLRKLRTLHLNECRTLSQAGKKTIATLLDLPDLQIVF